MKTCGSCYSCQRVPSFSRAGPGPSWVSATWTSPRRPHPLAMAHLPRELFISLVMDSASDWTVVCNSIIEFIRNTATHHAAKVCLLAPKVPSRSTLNTARISSHVSHISSTPLRTRAHHPLTRAYSFAKAMRLTLQSDPCKQLPETIFEDD